MFSFTHNAQEQNTLDIWKLLYTEFYVQKLLYIHVHYNMPQSSLGLIAIRFPQIAYRTFNFHSLGNVLRTVS